MRVTAGADVFGITQEKSECLTRESSLVKKHDGLRKVRKGLLSDLSSLVKTAKNFQDIANGTPTEDEVEYVLDEMLLKAFRIVTRGVRFLDVWNEEVGLSRTIAELEQYNMQQQQQQQADGGQYEVPTPLTPPSDTFPDRSPSVAETERNESRLLSRSRMDMSRASMRMETGGSGESQQPRPMSVSNKRVSHRVSYSTPSAAARNPNFASERLNVTYDAFLGVLGSFIGLHLQSRSSTELITTTEQSVQACRALLTVVEAVCDHGVQGYELLELAKEGMYDRLSELVHAAREAFRPAQSADDDVVFMPDEGKRLVDAATDCVRAAGNCCAKARLVLEQIGDFELEGSEETATAAAAVAAAAAAPKSHEYEHDVIPEEEKATPQPQRTAQPQQSSSPPQDHLSLRPPPPPLQIPNRGDYNNHLHLSAPSSSITTPGLTEDNTPSTIHSRALNSPAHLPELSCLNPPNSADKSSFSSSFDVPHSAAAENLRRGSNAKSEVSESFGRGVTSTGSSFTYNSHLRDSEMSGVSQTSTRATSPDLSSNSNSYNHYCYQPSLKGSVSHSTLAEENEETEANLLEKTYAHELIFKEGHIMGGSLRALIEKLTAHQSTPDAMFVSTFYLTFRLFATPLEFAQTLADRFEYIGDTPHAAGPVRLRVYNVLKGWLESHWRHDRDNSALDFVSLFAKTTLMQTLPSAGRRLVDLAEKVAKVHGPVVPRLVSSMGKTNTATAQYIHPDTPLPPPILGKKETNLLKQWKNGEATLSILDFDPMELARQLTVKESRIFCSILPEELLDTEWMKKSGSLAVNVRAMSTLSTDLAHLVSDSILQLEEPKKRAVVIKHWIKIASKSLELNNYDSLMAIICSLNSSMISRLKRTWEVVSQKTKSMLEYLRGIVDVSRNYSVLRNRIQNHVPPCLPFVGTYLTDLTFVDHGNQPLRHLPTDEGEMSVINFDKHMKTARIISELQRFQIPYRLTEVPELQAWMQNELVRVRSNGEKSLQTFYRRSLVLEPREGPPRSHTQSEAGAGTGTSGTSGTGSSIIENAKDKFDFLSWTHPKTKSVVTNG